MSSVVETVRGITPPECHAEECEDGDCSLSLDDVPEPNVLISLEHEAAPVKAGDLHCDYLFVGGNEQNGGLWVSPIELTAGKRIRIHKFKQIQAGANIAEGLLPSGAQVKFLPILAHNIEFRHQVRRNLQKNPVTFRGKKQLIRTVRCGEPLANALKG